MSKNQKLSFCTLFDSNYLSKGIAMYKSLKQHCSNFHLYIFAFDDITYKIIKEYNFDSVTLISLKEFETSELLKVKPCRSIAEYSWTCTPSTILYCLKTFNLDHCTYIDADLYFYSNPVDLFNEMGDKSIFITEHKYTTHLDKSDILGKYCVQYITFKNNNTGLTALKWWADACIEWCYMKPENGKFGDQKYLDDWLERFEGVHIMQNLGAGIAPWNIQQYKIIKANNTLYVKNYETKKLSKLIFYHFHFVKKTTSGFYISPRVYGLTCKKKHLLYKQYTNELSNITTAIKSKYQNIDPDGSIYLSLKKEYSFRDKFYIVRIEFLKYIKHKNCVTFRNSYQKIFWKGFYKI